MNRDTLKGLLGRLAQAVLALIALSVFSALGFAADPGIPFVPGANHLSDQKAGSLLIYNLYSSNPSNLIQENTRLNLTNTNPSTTAIVHLFFVDGSTCSPADGFVCLTPSQTISFLASDMDPGTSGYIVAIAVDGSGVPISFNWLVGDEFIKLRSGHAGNLGAVACAVVLPPLILFPVVVGDTTLVALEFDDTDYNRLPRTLAIDNFGSRADGNDTLVVINRIGGNLATGAGTIGDVFGALFDDTEGLHSFSFTSTTCQFRSSLSSTFPRITPRLEQIVPPGRSGWMKFWSMSTTDQSAFFGGTTSDARALVGSVLTANANAGAFTGGRNLHALTLNPLTVLIVPVVQPNCR